MICQIEYLQKYPMHNCMGYFYFAVYFLKISSGTYCGSPKGLLTVSKLMSFLVGKNLLLILFTVLFFKIYSIQHLYYMKFRII